MINALCLYFAQKPFSTLSRDACSINSPVNQERLSVSTKPREFEINIVSKNSSGLGDVFNCGNSVSKSLYVEDSYAF